MIIRKHWKGEFLMYLVIIHLLWCPWNIYYIKHFLYYRDHKILELLYEEAKYNILTGRYPCEISDYIMLGGIQARLELGPYDMTVHTPSYFRTIMYRFLPEHASWNSSWSSCLPWIWGRNGVNAAGKNSPEARLIEQFKVESSFLQKSSMVIYQNYK